MGKLRPAGQIRPAGSFILARRHLQKLKNSHHELSGRPFFPLKITDGSDFQKNTPQRCKIEMKHEVKNFYFGDHIRTWTVISEKKKVKKVFTLFSNQRAARGFNSFSKSGPSSKKLTHPCYIASGDSSTQKVWGGHFGAEIDLGGATENCVRERSKFKEICNRT